MSTPISRAAIPTPSQDLDPLTSAGYVISEDLQEGEIEFLRQVVESPRGHHAMSTPKLLSPAAQKLKDAVIAAFWDQHRDLPASPEVVAAAAIRALVESRGTPTRGGAVILNGDDVLAIATELEVPHG